MQALAALAAKCEQERCAAVVHDAAKSKAALEAKVYADQLEVEKRAAELRVKNCANQRRQQLRHLSCIVPTRL